MNLEIGAVAEVIFCCPYCKGLSQEFVDVPYIDLSSESSFNHSRAERVKVVCSECSQLLEGEIRKDIDSLEFVIIDKLGNELSAEVRDPMNRERVYSRLYEYWKPSDHPYDEFNVCIQGMRNLMGQSSPNLRDRQLLNRVIFCQIFTALEAYLSDTLINFVDSSVDAQTKIYETDKEMKSKTFLGVNILKDNELPKKHLLTYLRNLSFHNFPLVDRMFQNVLRTSLFKNDEDRALMNKARNFRHDCVHRNGKTVDGIKHDFFDEAYVSKIANVAEEVVGKVQKSLVNIMLDNAPKS